MKRVMMAFGTLSMMGFLSLIAGLGLFGSQAISAADDNKTIAVEVIRTISQTWSVDGQDKIVSSHLMRVARSPQGNRAFKIFSRLGALVRADNVSQTQFGISTKDGTTATVVFIGTFTRGTAKLTVKLHKQGGVMKLLGFKTTQSMLRPPPRLISA